MPTLENIQGASLVGGDPTAFINTLGKLASNQREDRLATEKRAREQAKIDEEVQATRGLLGRAGVGAGTGLSAEDEEKSLDTITGLDANFSREAQQVVSQGTPEQIEEFRSSIQTGTEKAVELRALPTHEARVNMIQKDISKKMADGTASQEQIDRALELSNMSPQEFDLELLKTETLGTEFNKLVPPPVDPQDQIVGYLDTPEGAADFAEFQIRNPTAAKNILDSLPKVKEGFTLSPGQQRFGPGGEPIATVAPKPATKTSLIQNLEAIGIDPLSAEGKDIVKKSLTKPGVKIDLSEGLDFKIPTGFMLLDKNNPAAGVTPIPGGPKDNVNASEAAKTQMLTTAKKAFLGVRDAVFDKDGSLNRINIFNAGFNTPFTDGRKLRNQMEFGIQAITRAETGAAMPPGEVENTRTRFMPQLGDTVEIVNTKLDMYESFINGSLKLLDPSGRFDAERFDTELEARASEGLPTATNPETGEKMVLKDGVWQPL